MGNIAGMCFQKSVKNVDELNRRQIETWLGIQQSVIDQAIDQWRIRLNACVKPKESILNTHNNVQFLPSVL